MQSSLFYHSKQLFGLDITTEAIRVMQTIKHGQRYKVQCYGSAPLQPGIIKEGIITDPQAVATTIRQLLKSGVTGEVTTTNVALSIPVARTFSRAVRLPKLGQTELQEAVQLEVEQYTPVAIDNLYTDYSIISTSGDQIELLTVAAPKQIVDSYLAVTDLLGLRAVTIETTVEAAYRLFAATEHSDLPTVLVTINRSNADMSIIDKAVVATASASYMPATKSRQAVPKPTSTSKTDKTSKASSDPFITEVRRIIRYFEERYDQAKRIEQVVIFGDPSHLSDVGSRLTAELRMPARSSNPLKLFQFEHDVTDLPTKLQGEYLTAAGLSIIQDSELAG